MSHEVLIKCISCFLQQDKVCYNDKSVAVFTFLKTPFFSQKPQLKHDSTLHSLQTLLVDHAHYFSQLLWVLANALWAGGEIFRPEYDEPYPLIDG